MNYAIEILLEQKTLIESELVHAEGEERTELERRLIDTANALNTLNLPIVSNRRELLNFLKWYDLDIEYNSKQTHEQLVLSYKQKI